MRVNVIYILIILHNLSFTSYKYIKSIWSEILIYSGSLKSCNVSKKWSYIHIRQVIVSFRFLHGIAAKLSNMPINIVSIVEIA